MQLLKILTKKTLVVFFFIGLSLLFGCGFDRNSRLRKSAFDTLQRSDVKKLVADASSLWHAAPEEMEVEEEQWPKSFHQFTPVRVRRDSYGVYLIIGKSFSHTAGVYIVVECRYVPKNAPNGSYERLSEGIYWALTS